MPKKRVLLSEIDVGEWARHYASRPYGHFKGEIYPVFVGILSCLPDGARVLDVGAGPGHLAREFYKRNPDSGLQFVLLDASVELLKIAESRLPSRRVATVHGSFNGPDWAHGLGDFDAVVSNNALFHVRPEKLDAFYESSYGLLRRDGLLLNQQSFAWDEGMSPYGEHPFARFIRGIPWLTMPKRPKLSEEEERRLEREDREARARHAKAIEEAKASGVEFAEDQTGYQFLTVERHLTAMRKAGFQATCVWRKREFAVVLGAKGAPEIDKGRLRTGDGPEQ